METKKYNLLILLLLISLIACQSDESEPESGFNKVKEHSDISFTEGMLYQSFSMGHEEILYSEQYRGAVKLANIETQETQSINLASGAGPGEVGSIIGGAFSVEGSTVVADPTNAKFIRISEDGEKDDLTLDGHIPLDPIAMDKQTVVFRSQTNPASPVVLFNIQSEEFNEIEVDHGHDTDSGKINFLTDGRLDYNGTYLFYISLYGADVFVIDPSNREHIATIDYDENELEFASENQAPDFEFMLIDTAIHPETDNLLLLKGRREDSPAPYNRNILFELSIDDEKIINEYEFDYSVSAIFNDDDYLYTFSSDDWPHSDESSMIRQYEFSH